MHSHIGCICLTFLHCVFSNVFSKRLHERIHNHIGCIFLTFLHSVLSNVSSNHLPERKHSCIGCICGASPHYESANAFWYGLHVWMNSYTGSSCGIHPSSHTWFENFPSPFLKSKEDLRIVLHRLTPFPWMRQWKNAFKERRPQKGKVFPFPTNLSAQNIYIPKW